MKSAARRTSYVEEVREPQPETGETLVRVRAGALNHRDVFITQGLYPNVALPCMLGADGAGEANGTAVVIDPTIGWGPDERVWTPEARILGIPRDGTFAQYVCVPHENVHAKPAHLSFEEAAALPLAGVTAYRATFTRGELRPRRNASRHRASAAACRRSCCCMPKRSAQTCCHLGKR